MCKYGPLKKGQSYKKHEKGLASLVGDYRVAGWPYVSLAVGQPVMVTVAGGGTTGTSGRQCLGGEGGRADSGAIVTMQVVVEESRWQNPVLCRFLLPCRRLPWAAPRNPGATGAESGIAA